MFLFSGMVDSQLLTFPNYTIILSTCKAKVALQNQQHIICSILLVLDQYHWKKEHTPDELLSCIDLIAVRNYNDEEAYHYTEYELFQRSKCLSHIYQRKKSANIYLDSSCYCDKEEE